MYNLKSCPFCGGRAFVYSGIGKDVNGNDKPEAFCYCEKCLAQSTVILDGLHDGTHIEKAVERWNHRV